MFNQDLNLKLHLEYAWSRPEKARRLPDRLSPADPNAPDRSLFEAEDVSFSTSLSAMHNQLRVEGFQYLAGPARVSLSRVTHGRQRNVPEYELGARVNGNDNYLVRVQGRAWGLPPPVKCYGFPDEVFAY